MERSSVVNQGAGREKETVRVLRGAKESRLRDKVTRQSTPGSGGSEARWVPTVLARDDALTDLMFLNVIVRLSCCVLMEMSSSRP